MVKRGGAPARVRSPESMYIRTGKVPNGADMKKARALMTRFLGRTWYNEYTARPIGLKPTLISGRTSLPLPTFRQRLYGGRFSPNERGMIDEQVRFALKTFAPNLRPAERAKLSREIITTRFPGLLSVDAVLEKGTHLTDPRLMWETGRELYKDVKADGNTATGYATGSTSYLAKGWSRLNTERSTPLHETVHTLQSRGLIKVDVPIAAAAERLRGFERGEIRVNPRRRAPMPEEIDKLPRHDGDHRAIMKKGGVEFWNESQGSYAKGYRIAQWAYQNLPKEQRWPYLYALSMGRRHANALEYVGMANRKAAPVQFLRKEVRRKVA